MSVIRTLVVACTVVLVLAALVPAVAAPRRAPDFELQLFNGATFRLAEARGSAVILLFWAPW